MHSRRLRPVLLVLAALLTVALLTVALAQAQSPLRIGVVLPGRASTGSANWNELLAARAWERSVADGSAGINVEVHFEDGGNTPENTRRAIERLLGEHGVHGIVCCVNPPSAAAAAEFAPSLPILSLARPNTGSGGHRGPLIIEAGPQAQALAIALDARSFGGGVGLMTLDNSYGREIAAAVVAGLVAAGLPLARAETYPPGAPVLTPEALLVAASEPAAVIVWGLPGDTVTAIDGLRARGYEGTVYVPWQLASELPGGIRNARLRGARVTAPPSELSAALPADHPNRAPLERFRRTLAEAYGAYSPTTEGALTFDALELLLAAGELAFVYGVDPAATERFRLALSDALVALRPLAGAAGSYDYDGRDPELALARGLVVAKTEGGRLRPADD
jgi:ABC-type branched-subunit amino acid transport system substrate-binding protein